MFRLRRAIGPRLCELEEVTRSISTRLHLTKRLDTLGQIGSHLSRGRNRCRECGCSTRAKYFICAACAADLGSKFCLVDRSYIRQVLIGWKRGEVERLIRELPMVKRRRHTCAHLYWLTDVDEAVRRHVSHI